jgi:hypothetical protein
MRKIIFCALILSHSAMATDLSKALLYQSFEQYAPGTSQYDVEGKFNACRNGKVREADGKRVLETSIGKGETGWGHWGYGLESLPKLRAGDELWYRVAMFFPEEFDFWTDHGSLKTFRFCRQTISDKKNRGCVDMQIQASGSWRIGSEYDNWGKSWLQVKGGKVVKGEWGLFEVYMKMGDPGIMRMWKDGVLFAEYNQFETLQEGAQFLRVLQFTYWNGSAPKTQGMLMDHITVFIQGQGYAGKQYLSTDVAGNRYIGMTLGGYKSYIVSIHRRLTARTGREDEN